MINILKYEFMKKKKGIKLLLGITLMIEIATILKSSKGSSEHFMILPVLTIGYAVSFLIGTITSYSKDFSNKEGYMIYMLPYSGTKITLAKALYAVLEGIGLTLLLTMIYLYNSKFIGQMPNSMSLSFNLIEVNIGLSKFLYMVSSIFLAITTTRSIFSKIKFKGIITFGIFIGMTNTVEKLTRDIGFLSISRESGEMIGGITSSIVFYLLFALFIYIIGWLIDNKTDF